MGLAHASPEERTPSVPVKKSFQFQVYFINPEIRYERGEDQNLDQKQPHNYSVAIRRDSLSLLLETANLSESTGNPALQVDRRYEDYSLWGRLHFLNIQKEPFRWSLYATLGVGSYQEIITTRLGNQSITDNGNHELMTGLGVGTDLAVLALRDFGFVLGIEGRLLFGRDFDPNPQMSALLRMGLQF